jgi:hypothetical protein
MLIELTQSTPGCIGASDNGDGTYRLDFDGFSRLATADEVQAATVAAARAAIKPVTRRQMLTALHRSPRQTIVFIFCLTIH